MIHLILSDYCLIQEERAIFSDKCLRWTADLNSVCNKARLYLQWTKQLTEFTIRLQVCPKIWLEKRCNKNSCTNHFTGLKIQSRWLKDFSLRQILDWNYEELSDKEKASSAVTNSHDLCKSSVVLSSVVNSTFIYRILKVSVKLTEMFTQRHLSHLPVVQTH